MTAVVDNNAMRAVFEHPHSDGTFGPSASYLRETGQRRPLLLLPFAPHAGGDRFPKIAAEAIGGEIIAGSHAEGGRDAAPYLPNFLAAYLDLDAPPPVMVMPMQAHAANRRFVEAFDIKPVIMVRNIADMLASLWDELDNDAGGRRGVNCLVPGNFKQLNGAQKSEFMMDIVAPWYVSYFASWKEYADEQPERICILTFQDFCRRPVENLHTAVSHAGFSTPATHCARALRLVWRERIRDQYNESHAGRGLRYFSIPQREKLQRMLWHYPHLASWREILCGGFGVARAA